MSVLKKIDENFEEYICAFLLSVIVILLGIQIVLRFGFKRGLDWSNEIIGYAFVWMNYLGVAMGAKRLAHIRITTFVNLMPENIKKISLFTADILWVLFNIAVVLISFEMIERMTKFKTLSPSLQINIIWSYSIIPIGFALTTFRVIQANFRAYRQFRKQLNETESEEA